MHALIGITIAAVLLATVATGFFLIADHSTKQTLPARSVQVEPENAAPVKTPITAARLNALRWQELGSLVSEVTADTNEISRVTGMLENSDSPVNLYLRALLLMAQNRPALALGVFDKIDISSIPADFLYAPHRLHRSLRPETADRYLERLRQVVTADDTSALIRARILAGDGELEQALSSYMKSDPATWAQYDLVLFRKIGSYQGLSIDLARMIGGAISSGRVRNNLEPRLKQIAREPVSESELSAFEQRIREGIANGTPEGKIALESAATLLRDRKIFLNRNYEHLLSLYASSEPVKLATETLLLLFLSAIDQNHRLQAEIWGQELKRRHAELEVRDWVNKMMVSLK